MNYILAIITGYLLGSLSFGLIIGKLFYKIDIRQHGSKNLGGSNAGRVFGKKIGLLIMILDAIKCIVAYLSIYFYTQDTSIATIAAIAAIIGHCYPLFASFKGGKAVASVFGYLLVYNPILFLIGIPLIFLNLKITKIVSISTMLSITTVVVINFFIAPLNEAVLLAILDLFVIYRHKDNIKRILNKTEKKITWM